MAQGHQARTRSDATAQASYAMMMMMMMNGDEVASAGIMWYDTIRNLRWWIGIQAVSLIARKLKN